MIDAFEKWVVAHGNDFKEQGFVYEVTKSPLDISNPSVRVDFDNDKYLSRITVWSTGECKLEAIDIETEDTILDRFFVLESDNDFDDCFSELFVKIKLRIV